jgi:tetratricopeptide (TPR) repeat protein
MNQALKIWRDQFTQQPVEALDRLIQGLVPLGVSSQLSLGEILNLAFDPEDPVLDGAVRTWLAKQILQPLPDGMIPTRWSALLDEFLRGIATMGLKQTGALLQEDHSRIRLWLRGFYEGPDRDPEGSYLLALAHCQSDQRFSGLWRRLVLGEEFFERSYRDIGLLGFRKMPDAEGKPAADVPVGLLHTVVELADSPKMSPQVWKQIVRCIFAAYPRSQSIWIEKFFGVLRDPSLGENNAEQWLESLLSNWEARQLQHGGGRGQAVSPPTRAEREQWVEKVTRNTSLCGSPELDSFLGRYRAYTSATGDSEYLVKTFNNLANRVVGRDASKVSWAENLLNECIRWQPNNPHNYTVISKVLWSANRQREAINILWNARQRFPWNPLIRNELGKLLREDGDLVAALGVFREAAAHFPDNFFSRTGLALAHVQLDELDEALEVSEQAHKDFPDDVFFLHIMGSTLQRLNRLMDARKVLEQACRAFPNDPKSRTELANLLIDSGELDGAETLFQEAWSLDAHNEYARSGLAEVWFIKSAKTKDTSLRDSSKALLQQLADEGVEFAASRLRNYNQKWSLAVERRGVRYKEIFGESSEENIRALRETQTRTIQEMSAAERLGRAMIALWQAERTSPPERRNQLCVHAQQLLDVSDAEAGELLTGFVETRGLVLLAKGDAISALKYFDEQVERYGRGGWIGVRLGEQRARLALGKTIDSSTDESPFDSRSARFTIQVANVIQLLTKNGSEQEVGDILRNLYPNAASLAEQWAKASEEGSSNPADTSIFGSGMIAAFIRSRWFRVAGIFSANDLANTESCGRVFAEIRRTQNATFDVLASAAVSFAA